MTSENGLEKIVLEPSTAASACVIWLHGLGADGNDFVPIVPILKLPENHGVRFIFPHAPVRPITLNGGMEMRGWYDIVAPNLKRDVDESGIKSSAAAIRQLIDAETASGIHPKNIIVAGFSQGGAIALHVGLRYEQSLAGIMALSTYLPFPNRLSDELHPANNHTPVFVGHGSADSMVPEQLGASIVSTLNENGIPTVYHTYPMEHAVSAEEIDDIAKWLLERLAL